jgi:hypothetical protein
MATVNIMQMSAKKASLSSLSHYSRTNTVYFCNIRNIIEAHRSYKIASRVPPSVTKDCRYVLLSSAESAKFYFFFLVCVVLLHQDLLVEKERGAMYVDELLPICWSERRKWEGKSSSQLLPLCLSLFTVLSLSLSLVSLFSLS